MMNRISSVFEHLVETRQLNITSFYILFNNCRNYLLNISSVIYYIFWNEIEFKTLSNSFLTSKFCVLILGIFPCLSKAINMLSVIRLL